MTAALTRRAGLEMHVSNSVEDALNLLFLGDTNRYASLTLCIVCMFTVKKLVVVGCKAG